MSERRRRRFLRGADDSADRVPTWEEIARDHGRFIYTVAYRLTGNPDDAQDLVQEVLVRVQRGLATYQPGALHGWLGRITTNAFLDDKRREKRRPSEALPEQPDLVLPPAPAADEALAVVSLSGDVTDALGKLSESFRTPLVMCDLIGMSYDEIAEALDIPVGTVRSRIHRAAECPEDVAGMNDEPLSDEHAGELLSVLADGELTATERVNVEMHLALCSQCTREFETIERSRLAMMALPELDLPTDFIAGMVRDRHLKLIRGGIAGFAIAVIAAVALLSADLLPERSVEPELATFAADHSATVVTAPQAPTLSQTARFPGITIDNDVIGFDLIAVSEDDDVVHVVFRQDKRVVSLFGQRGEVDWDSLPLDGRRMRIGGRDGWQARDESSTVLDVDGNVLTFVGGDAQIQAVLASQVVDSAGPGLWDRAHDAAQIVMGAFDFG